MVNKDDGGIINVYKPIGMTSFAVVSRIRKLTGIKKVGHCGTLDPFAEGVLPVCIGRATAAVQYMDQYDKKYRAEIIFGAETDTQDRTGTVIRSNPPTERDLLEMKENDFAGLRKAVGDLVGSMEQLPPMYSAIKFNGTPLYKYARQGIEIERKTRKITIYDAKILDISAKDDLRASIEIHCSKGTYIRTIGDTLGRILSYGAFANSLVRTACGPFTLEHCFTLEQIAEFLRDNPSDPLECLEGKNVCLPVEFAMSHMKKITLDKEASLKIIQGQKIHYDARLSLEEPLLTFCVPDRFIGITKGRELDGERTILSAERIFVDVADYQ